MKSNDIEIVLAKIIVVTILAFTLLFYGSRYHIDYSTIMFCETAIFSIYHALKVDQGQELLVAIITDVCAVVIGVLCLQLRMDLTRVLLVFASGILGNIFILFCDRSNIQSISYPIIVLTITFLENVRSEILVKACIIGAILLSIPLYIFFLKKRNAKEKQ